MADDLSQDSLLATPLILDLTILAEFLTRVQYRKVGHQEDFSPLYPVLSLLSYMLKAPLVKPGMTPYDSIMTTEQYSDQSSLGTDVVNSLNRQRNALESFLKACVGLEGNSDLLLETRLW